MIIIAPYADFEIYNYTFVYFTIQICKAMQTN